ncbi:MAG: hypothetical protein LBL97_01080 [Prevotellaceae bacterium]|jgi:hypothetical protein|nr:hypothetical protein [Prevotellaceae bacterium]
MEALFCIQLIHPAFKLSDRIFADFIPESRITERLVYNRARELRLVKRRSKVVFTPLEQVANSPYGARVMRTISTESILAMHPILDYCLELLEPVPGTVSGERAVTSIIDCPEYGKFAADSPDILRQVCYI